MLLPDSNSVGTDIISELLVRSVQSENLIEEIIISNKLSKLPIIIDIFWEQSMFITRIS